LWRRPREKVRSTLADHDQDPGQSQLDFT